MSFIPGYHQIFTKMLLFLTANNDVLLRRFKETRRFHPLLKDTMLDAIKRERDLLKPVMEISDRVIDTSDMNSYALRRFIFDLFSDTLSQKFKISFVSFGFKKGIPSYLDMLFDVRGLPNPFYEEHLRDLDGRTQDIKDFVFSSDSAKNYVDSLIQFLEIAVESLKSDGRLGITIGIGCTGGMHRSVAVAEYLGYKFLNRGYRVSIYHRELGEYKDLLR